MRSRDVTIPLALWICAALCAHFLFGTGGLVVATVHEDRSELWKLSHRASGLAQQGESTVEVTLGDSPDEAPTAKPVAPPPPSKTPDAPSSPAKAEARKPPQPPVAPPEPKRVVVIKKDDAKAPPPPKDFLKDQRIAVRQHAKADQEDNPTAKFIADDANHVEKETRAAQTSHDRDDEQPNPGSSHRSSESTPGNSETSRVAENAERAGVRNRAPGERGTDLDVQKEAMIPRASTVAGAFAPAVAGLRAAPSQEHPDGRPPQAQAPTPEPQPPAGGATPASPEVQTSPGGSWSFNPTQPSGAPGTTPAPRAGAAGERPPGGRMWSLPGLGQSTPAGGAYNTNLNQRQVASIVGEDNFRRIREADGERRKSEHRGSWVASNFDRWRSAIENYVTTVREGNQTALNAARVPFATYLNGIHNRIHPIFAESFLDSLDRLPADHPLNDQTLMTKLEIVLTREGRLKKMGVVKTSGITAFDIAALDAVDRAQPFGPAPSAIISPDGNVYLHWEFHRDHVFACSTMNAQPYILNVPRPSQEVPPAPGPARPPTEERGAPPASPNDSRQGALTPRVRAQSGT